VQFKREIYELKKLYIMENLIKTKKIETRFFLTSNSSSNTNTNLNKNNIASNKIKDKKDLLNTTAPVTINLNSSGSNNTHNIIFSTNKNNQTSNRNS
jgi:hypothetical protein